MRTVRTTANFLYYLTRTAAILYIVTDIYSLLVILLSVNGTPAWLPMEVLNDGSFRIFYPFTRSPFLLGDYNSSFLTMMIFILSFYGLFLWLLSSVFNTFRQQKLFTPKGVLRLSRFYITNLIVPVVSLLIAVLFYKDGVSDILVIALLHVIIGIFAFFMAAIFRQGLVLQEEQDLTL